MNPTHILIVEDELIFARNLQLTIEKLGCIVDGIVRSGPDAVRIVDQSKPDLVIMDIHIEGPFDGIETARFMQARDIPVIFLTAFGDKDTLERAKQAEPYGYLTKPADFQQLPYAIEITLYKHCMNRKLRDSEHLLSAILFSIGDGVIATDASDHIVLLNPMAETLTGWSSAEARNQTLRAVFDTEPTKATIDGGTFQQETTLTRRDGRRSLVRTNRSSLTDDSGRNLGFVIVFHDITEQKQCERDRERYIEELKSAMASIKTLSGLIPICANCKKIRTDSGYWMQVEQYVREHSDADFTHSICPQCITELYPRFNLQDSDTGSE